MPTKIALILAAHADDETLGAGGLIQKLQKASWDVRVVVVSDGRISVRETVQDNRPDAIRACARLGLKHEPTFLGFPDQKFDTVPMAELANAVLALKLNPDLVVTHAATDLNLDHRITLDMAKIAGRPKSKPVSLLSMEIPAVSAWNAEVFAANYFVDITHELDAKLGALGEYRNELQAFPHPISLEGIRTLAQYHGVQMGVPFAEAFQLLRGYAGGLP